MVLILKIITNSSARKPNACRKMQDWEAWVRGQRIAMTIWYDPERSIRIWCLHEDDDLTFPYRLQKFPLFLSSSYRLQKFVDTNRRRVNRRPIRKDFFPDRYDFVPIVFTSSSCKRGLSVALNNHWPKTFVLSERARQPKQSSFFFFCRTPNTRMDAMPGQERVPMHSNLMITHNLEQEMPYQFRCKQFPSVATIFWQKEFFFALKWCLKEAET